MPSHTFHREPRLRNHMKKILLPILIVIVGVGWLLTTLNVLPGVNWAWVLGLAGVGILTPAVGGLDRFTVLAGPFLIIASFFSLLRQTERIAVDVEVPSLVITFGLLMLLVRVLPLPTPRWMIEERREAGGGR